MQGMQGREHFQIWDLFYYYYYYYYYYYFYYTKRKSMDRFARLQGNRRSKWAKGYYATCEQRRPRSAGATAQLDQNLPWLHFWTQTQWSIFLWSSFFVVVFSCCFFVFFLFVCCCCFFFFFFFFFLVGWGRGWLPRTIQSFNYRMKINDTCFHIFHRN